MSELSLSGTRQRAGRTYCRGNSTDSGDSARTGDVAGDSSSLCLCRDMGSLCLLLHLQVTLFQVKHLYVGLGEDFVDRITG
jgi:hypothetical protein